MGNTSDASKRGYDDGRAGREPNNTDKMTGVAERGASILGDVVTGNVFNNTQSRDEKADAYDKAYGSGTADRGKDK